MNIENILLFGSEHIPKRIVVVLFPFFFRNSSK